MIKCITILLLTISILSFGTPAFAGLQKGLDAAERGDFATAFIEWKPLADAGDAYAQNNLGAMYDNGQGVPQDYNGQGVPQDYKEAFKWYKLAAEQGQANAQSNLGVMYSTGRGVPQDYLRAYMWINIAAFQGADGAAKQRDLVAKEMTPADISKAWDMATECAAKNYKDC